MDPSRKLPFILGITSLLFVAEEYIEKFSALADYVVTYWKLNNKDNDDDCSDIDNL